MQRVIHEYRNRSRIFGMIEGLYSYVSDTEYKYDDVLWLDETFKPLCDILQAHLLIFRTPEIKHFEMPVIECSRSDTISAQVNADSAVGSEEITVCLSGGKDSAACAYYYKKKGYTVHLYHCAGVNKAYGDEKKAAQAIADYLGCDLFIDKVCLYGTQSYIEHPLKNYIIANGAIHYCLAKGYTPHIAFGNFSQSYLDDNVFEVCAGDCVDMWDAYRPIIKKVLPQFELETPLRTNADTFELLSGDWELFGRAVSCMSPFRFREHWKHRTEERYNVRLFPNRCGCCWKCCLESMWLMDKGKVEYNDQYYQHCYDILERTIHKETGCRAESAQAVWDNYMFYPIEESKAYDFLMNREVKSRKVFDDASI